MNIAWLTRSISYFLMLLAIMALVMNLSIVGQQGGMILLPVSAVAGMLGLGLAIMLLTPKKYLVVAFFLVLSGCLIAWFLFLQQHRDHYRWYQQVGCLIKDFAPRRPPGVSRAQWALCLSHTWNLHNNFGGGERWTVTDRDTFIRELRNRLRGEVRLETIDWFWDAYTTAVPRARSYLHYRPTQTQLMKDAETSGYDLNEWPTQGRDSNCVQILEQMND